MTNLLLGGILAFAVATAVECYLLLGRVQLLFNHAELILRAAHTLLSAIPGKSAERTQAALDEQPRRWWQTLRRLAELRDHLDQVAGNEPDEDLIEHAPEPSDEDPGLARWADDGGAGSDAVDRVEPPPVLGPATRPARQVVLELAGVDPVAAAATGTEPERDDVDRKLDRFTYAEGHHR